MAMGEQVCMRSVGNYDQILRLINEEGITHYCGAPTVQLSIASHKDAKKVPQHVITMIAGAAPTSTLINDLESKLNIEARHVYGLTETYGPIAKNYAKFGADPKIKATLDSSFMNADDVRVVRLIPDGEELVGELVDVRNDGTEVGEIVFRGNIVMSGYHNQEEATKKAFEGGYMHTGDLAVRFPNGSFAIQDRAKDIIISGGENISSLSVESALTSHPSVLEVAVVAIKDEKWGERPFAFVVLTEAGKKQWNGRHLEFEIELKEFSKHLLPGFARPAFVEVTEMLEKTSTGKIQKKELRKRLEGRKE